MRFSNILSALMEGMGQSRDYVVRDYGVSQGWCHVITDNSLGIAPVIPGWRFLQKNFSNEPPRLGDLAELSQSWNYTEASLGIAALAAAYPIQEGEVFSASRMRKEIIGRCRDKSVILSEHFPVLEHLLASVCELKILTASEPKEGDYPWYLAPYLIPDADILIIPDKCLALKTADRLLELGKSSDIFTILAGSAVPGTQIFRKLGADICMRFLPEREVGWLHKVSLGVPASPLHSYEQVTHPARLPREMDILTGCPVFWQEKA